MVGTLHVVHAADKVLEEVALALSGGAEQVRAPQHQGTRPVHGVIDVFDREFKVAGVQALCHIIGIILSFSRVLPAASALSARSSEFSGNCG